MPALHVTHQGSGPTVVFVHGTPSSSFEFRHVIEHLSTDHQCVSVDHLGFGQSPKPVDGDYSLTAHQQRFEAFLKDENIKNAVFVLHDFGAAIALPALWSEPERCRGVVLLNTFLWPAEGPASWIARAYGTGIGQWIYRTFNVSVGVLLPYAWGTRSPLTAELKAAYQAPLADADARRATAALPAELVGSTLAALSHRAQEVAQWPVHVVWGLADRLVGPDVLRRWEHELPSATIHRLEDVGHFVAEEAPEDVAHAVRLVSQSSP